MEKLTIQPNKKYSGTATINDYGEINFRPYNHGTHPSNIKLVCRMGTTALYESAHTWEVRISISKTDLTPESLVKTLAKAQMDVVNYFHDNQCF